MRAFSFMRLLTKYKYINPAQPSPIIIKAKSNTTIDLLHTVYTLHDLGCTYIHDSAKLRKCMSQHIANNPNEPSSNI